MLMCFVFHEYLGAEEKNKQKTSEVSFSISLEWLKTRFFQRNRHCLGLASSPVLFSNRDMDVFLSVH